MIYYSVKMNPDQLSGIFVQMKTSYLQHTTSG